MDEVMAGIAEDFMPVKEAERRIESARRAVAMLIRQERKALNTLRQELVGWEDGLLEEDWDKVVACSGNVREYGALEGQLDGMVETIASIKPLAEMKAAG